MRFVAVLVAVLLLTVAAGCSDSKKQKRRAATLARLAKIDCRTVAARATRCDSAVRRAADEKQRKTGKKNLSLRVTLGLTAFKSESRCRKYVRQRVAFLRKNCKRYGAAADVCRKAQHKYLRGLEALDKCFASEDCDKIAACYVERYADTQL